NLKYVTIGLLLLSVCLSFVFSSFEFRFGGGVGNMISDWLTGALGNFGTAAILFVIAFGYIIWQFNPAFNIPAKKEATTAPTEEEKEWLEGVAPLDEEEEEEEEIPAATNKGKKSKDGPLLIIEEPQPAFD